MKRTDLEKNKAHKINNSIKKMGGTDPFGRDGEKIPDKREQRKLDQALGLVPFAVKINIDIVQKIQDIAKEESKGLNEVVTELLQKGLDNRK